MPAMQQCHLIKIALWQSGTHTHDKHVHFGILQLVFAIHLQVFARLEMSGIFDTPIADMEDICICVVWGHYELDEFRAELLR